MPSPLFDHSKSLPVLDYAMGDENTDKRESLERGQKGLYLECMSINTNELS